jgi:hypothetical protein
VGSFTDLATALGVPAGGLAFAAALYRGSIALEKEAKPDALTDIAKILKSPSWAAENWPSRIVKVIFEYTFGIRQLSISCVIRSVIASVAFLFSILFASFVIDGPYLHPTAEGAYCSLFANIYGSLVQTGCSTGHDPVDFLKLALFLSIIPDYVSIAKARFILTLVAESKSIAKLTSMVCADILLCFWISWVTMTVYWFIIFLSINPEQDLNLSVAYVSFHMVYSSMVLLFDDLMGRGQGWNVYEWFIGSTILTSIWTIFVLASSVLTKLILPPLSYIRRFTVWYFDVDRHPIRAIGFVGAALVFMGSVVAAIIR